ncbi:hypothetical protein [Spartinivicinus poritis]|uniref:Uncharacterized protein n=1 Tax=Spartinivicinus poritis TaxID=2994640 RepID=A0ABT5UHI1_9GAMM|nr:hypothetical protein [Spartinivicinus sp. A2-2]MDE1465844.1 hypothetical protein [Spartinivicinus sp. A2-2]
MEEVYLASKSKLQMLFTYLGVSISISLSIALSVLLFCSISDNPNYKLLFAGLAITFELGKFLALPEILISIKCKDWIRAVFSSLLFTTLTIASIFGSIGGLQSDTQKVQANIEVAEVKKKGFIEEREQILSQIEQNSKAIDMYIEMKKEKYFAAPLKAKNEDLRLQAAELQQKINSVSVPAKTQMIALLEALSTAVEKDKKIVQVYVFILLAILLDFAACFFIDIIQKTKYLKSSLLLKKSSQDKVMTSQTNLNLASDSNIKTKDLRTRLDEKEIVRSVTPINNETLEGNGENKTIQNNTNILNFTKPKSFDNYEQVREEISAIQAGKRISKNKVMKILRLGKSTVDKYFDLLITEGLIFQDQKNGLYFRSQNAMYTDRAL